MPRRTTVKLAFLCLLGMVLPAAADPNMFGFHGLRSVQLPDSAAGFTPQKNLKSVEYISVNCEAQDPLLNWLHRPDGQFYNEERVVTAKVPPKYDLGNHKIVNAIILGGLLKAWRECQSWEMLGTGYNYSHVTVQIVQGGVLKVRSARTDSRDGIVTVREVENAVIAQRNEELRQQQLAEQSAIAAQKARKRSAYWSSVWNWIKIGFFIAIGVVAFRVLPPYLTRIKWFFFPHPAVRALRRATRVNSNEYVDGKVLAEALSFVPANDTEAQLAARDLAELRDKVRKKHERLTETEKLEKETIDMERAKVRSEELRKYGTRK
jgi:hypothetical protein